MDGCTELLVTHDDGTRECAAPECLSPDPLHHEWRVECGAMDEPCADCAPPAARPVRPRRAA